MPVGLVLVASTFVGSSVRPTSRLSVLPAVCPSVLFHALKVVHGCMVAIPTKYIYMNIAFK